MLCPFYLHEKTDVYNTRPADGGLKVWRRRKCLTCGKAFTTQETADPSGVWSIRKNGKLHAYSRAKLAMSLMRACDHRLNEDATVWYLFEAVEQQLYPTASASEQILTTSDIYKKASEILKRFDAAAYVKYISFHRPTMDARTLQRELRKK